MSEVVHHFLPWLTYEYYVEPDGFFANPTFPETMARHAVLDLFRSGRKGVDEPLTTEC